MRVDSAHGLRSLLISRVVMGSGGGAFLVRAVVLVRLMFPGKDRVFASSRLYLEWPACCRMRVYGSVGFESPARVQL